MWTLELAGEAAVQLVHVLDARVHRVDDALGVAGIVLAGKARELERAVLREDQELGALLGGGAHPDAELADVVVPAVVPVDGIGGGGDLHLVLPAGGIPPAAAGGSNRNPHGRRGAYLILLKTKGKMELETGWNWLRIRLAILACRLRGRHDINKRLIETGASRGGDDAGGDSRGRPARLRREGVRGDGHPRDRRRRRMQRRLHLLSLRRQGGPARRLRRAYRGADGEGPRRGARRGCASGEPGGGGGGPGPPRPQPGALPPHRAGRTPGRGLPPARDGPAVAARSTRSTRASSKGRTRGSARSGAPPAASRPNPRRCGSRSSPPSGRSSTSTSPGRW